MFFWHKYTFTYLFKDLSTLLSNLPADKKSTLLDKIASKLAPSSSLPEISPSKLCSRQIKEAVSQEEDKCHVDKAALNEEIRLLKRQLEMSNG